MLLALHEGLQFGGYIDGLADDMFYGVLELGGVGGLQENAFFARLQSFGQGPVATGAVRVEQVMMLLPGFQYDL